MSLKDIDSDPSAVAPTARRDTVITFEDFDPGNGFIVIPNGYAGLNWDFFNVLNASERYPGDHRTGYYRGATSGDQVAYNVDGSGSDISIDSGTFSLKSVELTAAWNRGEYVYIEGFRDSNQIIEMYVKINDRSPTTVDLSLFKDIDRVLFQPIDDHQRTDPKQKGDGPQFAMDDLTFSDISPNANAVHAFAPVTHGVPTAPVWAFGDGIVAHHPLHAELPHVLA